MYKRQIQDFLWEHSRIPLHELERSGLIAWMERRGAGQMHADPWPITAKAENIAIVVAGGSHPTHACWLQTSIAKRMIGREIVLPQQWRELVASGARELGFDSKGRA